MAVRASVELLRNYDYVLEAIARGEAFLDGTYYDEVVRTGFSYRDAQYILNTRKPVDDVCNFMLENIEDIENININFEDISKKPAMYEELIKLPETTITSSFDHNLEIVGETTSKAEALKEMGKLMGIEKDEMMAIGDSPNDIAMLKEAGIAVAVGNAKDEVKAMADYIAPTNHEDGVADAIEKFVLSDQRR